VEVDRRKIETHGHIKEVGPHVVDITVYRDVKAQVTVNVVAEGALVPEAVVTEAEVVAEEGEAFVELTEAPAEETADAEVEETEEPAE
jgi:large subunit ribosomal protein L9